MTDAASVALSKSAFLDTNALVVLLAYWQACKDCSVSLSAVIDLKDLKSKLGSKVRLARSIPTEDYEPIQTGMKCFQNLSAAKEKYLFYTSTLCRSELHHVILSSIASERLIRRRVPHSLRMKRPQIMYRRVLEVTDYTAISTDLDEFFLGLRLDYGIAIAEVEDPATGPIAPYQTILEAAREIWSRVLIEVMDAYIFAAAVIIDADVFMTRDEALRDALNKLGEPTTLWQSAARSLKIALGKRQGDPLPRAMKPTGELR